MIDVWTVSFRNDVNAIVGTADTQRTLHLNTNWNKYCKVFEQIKFGLLEALQYQTEIVFTSIRYVATWKKASVLFILHMK